MMVFGAFIFTYHLWNAADCADVFGEDVYFSRKIKVSPKKARLIGYVSSFLGVFLFILGCMICSVKG